VCENCEQIHYQNPNIVAGTVPCFRDQVLLCKRAIEPRKGFWTLPAGFMENKETITEAALRETLEEAEAAVSAMSLYTVINVPSVDQVHMFFRGELVEGKFGAGMESLESRLFTENEIPWDQIAFKTVYITLRHYFSDRKSNNFPVRVEDVRWEKKPDIQEMIESGNDT
jgi:ADP-ribose pyrophosphatase YjhB (NUDIX family)